MRFSELFALSRFHGNGLWYSMRWARREKQLAKPKRELVLVDYFRADQMLKQNAGWKLAKEEDTNRQCGFVYLERPAEQHTGDGT